MAGMMTQQAGGSTTDALAIAKGRLAKGEITVAEFEEIKEALEG
jgi:uncharacterized membrane protein